MDNNFIKKISSDFILNILAFTISVGVIQLLVFPKFAKVFGIDSYGDFIAISSVINIITLSLGNNLCNVRLLVDNKYKELSVQGDFQLILYLACLLSIILLVIFNFSWKFPVEIIFGIAIYAVFVIQRSYYSVTYRLKLAYNKNLILNLIISVSLLVYSLFFIRAIHWSYAYVVANGLGLIFIWFTSNIQKEKLSKTIQFNSTLKFYLILVLSGFIGNLSIYLDKLIVYPILGAEAVSSYSVASFFGRSISLIVAPITSVLLSYFSTGKIVLNRKKYNQLNLIFIIIVFFFAVFSSFFAPIITKFLYPTIFEFAEPYILIANTAVIISIITSFNAIIVLKYAPSYWQIVIPSMNVFLYLLLGVFLLNKYGLKSFCYGLVIINIIIFIIQYVVGAIHISQSTQKV